MEETTVTAHPHGAPMAAHGGAEAAAASSEQAGAFLFFLGGLVLGGLLSAALGLDLFPARQRFEDQIRALRAENAQLQDQTRKLQGEIETLRREGGPAPPGGSAGERKTSSALPQAADLLAVLQSGDGQGAASGVRRLLQSGERGFDRLFEAIRAGVDAAAFDALDEGATLFPLIKVLVKEERLVAEFIAHSLVTPAFKEDPRTKDWFLRWAAWFLAGAGEAGGPSRGALHQSLDRQLRTGESSIWVVLHGLEVLDGGVPIEVIRSLLDDPMYRDVHGYLLKQLERRADREAVGVLRDFIAAHAGDAEWLRYAVEVLGRMPLEEAQRQIEALLDSPSGAVRIAAHRAYFSRERKRDQDLEVLLRFLNGDHSQGQERSLLAWVSQRNPQLFQKLKAQPQALADLPLRAALENAGQ